jgi:hypothetical protein
LLFGVALALGAGATADAAPWLFVTDIHLKATHQHSPPSTLGDDTDDALFESAVRAMQHADPHPPVVVVTGDLLSHDITKRTATPTELLVAKRLNRAFPDAQFVLALGNEDGACGDYALTPDSASLRAIADVWAPLVNRHGAAPDFARTFAHDGTYVARLPVPGLRAIVINDVYWSPRYRSGCGPSGDVGHQVMNELDAALQRTPGKAWVLFHIPPGVDAYSTAQLTHRLAIVPFLQPGYRDRLLAVLTASAPRIALVVTGHTHKFAYRIVDAAGPHPVPMLLVPAVSPIFRNAASFLTANVTNDGTLRDVVEMSYLANRWQTIGGLHAFGVDAFTGPQLVALHARLDREPKLHDAFARLYSGGGPQEITDRTWSVYACAATSFTTAAFRACDNAGGYSIFTQRGVKALIAVGIVMLLTIAGMAGLIYRYRRTRA